MVFFFTACTLGLRGEREPDEVLQLLPQISADKHPDVSAVVLLDQSLIEILPSGGYQARYRTVIKILKETGRHYGDVSFDFNSRLKEVKILHARTIAPDGRIIPLKENAIKIINPYSDYPEYSDYKELVFSLPGVEVGSVIDYEIYVKAKSNIRGHFSTRPFFQWTKPVLLSRYKITIPKEMSITYLALHPPKGVDPSPLITYQGDKKTYLWEFRDIPGVPNDEDLTPPEGEFTFNILITTMERWEDFFSWWRELIKGKTEPDEAIKRKTKELTEGLKGRKEKIEAIFDYVKRKIRYVSVNLGKPGYEPTPAREVFENKYGDCKDKSTLLISMLAAAGIKAYYVLIPTHYTENLIREIPFPFQFDHCIVAVPEGKDYLFLDPTDSMCRFGHLPLMDQGRNVLIFKDEKAVFAKTPRADPLSNGIFIWKTIKVGEDGSLEVTTEETYFGEEDSTMRHTYKGKSPAQIKKEVKDTIESWSFGAKLIDYSCTDPLNFREWFHEKTVYYIPDYCQKAGDILSFRIPDIYIGCSYVTKSRKYPLNIWGGYFVRQKAEIIPPPGYKILALPRPMRVKSPYLEYQSVYEEREGKIFYTQEFIQRAVRISPKEYPIYRDLCQKVNDHNRKEAIFFIRAGRRDLAGSGLN